MKIDKLLENVKVCRVIGYAEIDAVGIAIDDRAEVKGKVFVCLKGERVDGHDHAAHAVDLGAVAVVSEKEMDVSVPLILVKDTRKTLSILCGNFYGNPARKMNIVTVVGTNGKTSTTEILSEIFEYAGIPSATIGTLGYKIGKDRVMGELTTPDPIELHAHLAEMYLAGVKCVFMEASAHAIHYDKLAGIKSKVGIFTNITQDHLDFFKDMERYAAVKMSYFTHENTALAVVNSDDTYGVKLINEHSVPVISYGIENPADVFAIDIRDDASGLSFTINAFDCITELYCPLHGIFNVYNIMASVATAMYLGVGLQTIKEALLHMEPVPGRYNVHYVRGIRVVVDYAHTPDGLENILCDVSKITSGRVITVFGCGGDRDRSKRPIMGEIATRYSDFSVITEDNPRSEAESEIAADILGGIPDDRSFVTIEDRADAIRYALSMAKKGDTIVIAGKGHENYIEKNGVKIPYSDIETLKKSEE